MTGWLRPIPVAGAAVPGLPLAGQAHVRFASAQPLSLAGGEEPVGLAQMGDVACARLSGVRAPLCGLSLHRPRIMGILNVTPDSFSDGGRHETLGAAVAHARQMAHEADIIDIGGESTRPGAEEVSVEEEIRRTAPVIRAIRDAGLTLPISIDTRKAAVAEAALDAGADMVNDVSAFAHDPDLAGLVASRGVPVCLMHAKGPPSTMQQDPRYGDVVTEVLDHLLQRVDAAVAAGIARDSIVIDPGIGFGKTAGHNLDLLGHLSALHDLGLPILLGASRKRFIGTIGGAEVAADRVPGSVAVALYGVAQGAQVLRVHDVSETAQALRLWRAMATGAAD
ncbi:Dihydropteroate synthase, DHPS [Pseudooceanicola batsensis HTCC2597]|uniref:Dihydropteroate synthase n=1 Tax=Pseudooceanicola batsensis (strain ATCC BAA-863 / DSM 15984 / KCTC 12145 / HTCC2597) TaxID=252305 RepID=A3TTN0_PSEBH|nr:dihydropteroate synthase [Pseudooceanicola batsensis]EAQ05007.1 Dihydropteroate synthase, DHPS [Pseudooceanicola batsensis HTCC2597]